MSNYHVRKMGKDERSAKVIFHIPIPVENNSVSIALRTTLSESIRPRNEDGTFGTFQSDMIGIDAGELAQLQAGELFEYVETIGFLAAENNAQKQTKIDTRYTVMTTTVLDKVRELLKFWGLNRDV